MLYSRHSWPFFKFLIENVHDSFLKRNMCKILWVAVIWHLEIYHSVILDIAAVNSKLTVLIMNFLFFFLSKFISFLNPHARSYVFIVFIFEKENAFGNCEDRDSICGWCQSGLSIIFENLDPWVYVCLIKLAVSICIAFSNSRSFLWSFKFSFTFLLWKCWVYTCEWSLTLNNNKKSEWLI